MILIYTNNTSLKHISHISDTLYNMTDICNIFNIEKHKILEIIDMNNITHLSDSKNNLYMSSKDICELFILISAKSSINSVAFNDFYHSLSQNNFAENQVDRENRFILLNM